MELDILIIICHFNNCSEVNQFIKQLYSKNESFDGSFKIIVVDNSGEFSTDFNEVLVISENVNFGYLGAANRACEEWLGLDGNSVPKLTLISNTDMELPNNFFNTILGNINTAKINELGQVSVLVKSNLYGFQNPHILKRISSFRLFVYSLIFSNAISGKFYIRLRTNKKFRSKNKGEGLLKRSKRAYILQYAAHGSSFFLTDLFFKNGGKLSRNSFLFGEELVIGDQLNEMGLKSVCFTNCMIFHNEHQSTSKVNISKKVKWHFSSYKELLRNRFLNQSKK